MLLKLKCTSIYFTYVPAEAGNLYFCQEAAGRTPASLGAYEPRAQRQSRGRQQRLNEKC